MSESRKILHFDFKIFQKQKGVETHHEQLCSSEAYCIGKTTKYKKHNIFLNCFQKEFLKILMSKLMLYSTRNEGVASGTTMVKIIPNEFPITD